MPFKYNIFTRSLDMVTKFKDWVTAQIATHTAISDAHHTPTVAGDLNLNDLAEKNHVSLTNVTASQHHDKYLNSEAVAAVAAADEYVKNTGDNTVGNFKFSQFSLLPVLQNWLTNDTITNAGDGSWTLNIGRSVIQSGAITGNRHYMYFGKFYCGYQYFMTRVSPQGATHDSTIYLGFLYYGQNDFVNQKHIAFKLDNNVITCECYNTALTSAGSHNISSSAWVNLAIERASNTVRFYINYALVATITTNVPNTVYMSFAVSNKTNEDYNYNFDVASVLIQRY